MSIEKLDTSVSNRKLSEWKYSKEKKHYIPVCVKTEFVDGERIKEDTWYKLVNGNFEEQ